MSDDEDYYLDQLSAPVREFVTQYRSFYAKGPRPTDLNGATTIVPGAPIVIGLIRGMTREVLKKGRMKDHDASEIARALHDLVGADFAMMCRGEMPVAAHADIGIHHLNEKPNACLEVMLIYNVKRRVPNVAFGGRQRLVGDRAIVPIDFIVAVMREVRQTALPTIDPTLETVVAKSQTARLWANLVFPVIEFLIANPTKGMGYDDFDD